mgnify:FL=1
MRDRSVIDKNAIYHTFHIMIIKAYKRECDRVIDILEKTFNIALQDYCLPKEKHRLISLSTAFPKVRFSLSLW